MLLAAAPAAREQSGAGGMLKHLADTLVRLGGALEVFVGADLLADFLTLGSLSAFFYVRGADGQPAWRCLRRPSSSGGR